MKKRMAITMGLAVVCGALFLANTNVLASKGSTEATEVTEVKEVTEATGWKELASMPTSREMFQSEVINHKIYMTGCSWNCDPIKGRAPTEVYDPSTNKWKKLAPMPTARTGFLTVSLGDKIYAIGGEKIDYSGLSTATEVYDTSKNKWKKLAPMPIGLWEGVSFRLEAVDGKIYALGLIVKEGCEMVTEVYDPATDKWAILAPMTTPRTGFQTEVIDGKIYAIGGCADSFIFQTGPNTENTALSSAEVYDPSTNKWTTLSPMSTSRLWFPTEVIDGKIYAIGGVTIQIGDEHIQPLSSVEVYDPSTDKWTTLTNMSQICRTFQTEAIDGKIYAIGGLEKDYYDQDIGIPITEVYDPSTDKWTPIASMAESRFYFQTEVIDNVIYAISGMNSTNLNSLAVNTSATKTQ